MTAEPPFSGDRANVQAQESTSRPTINWNRVSSGGLRTSLRASRPATTPLVTLTTTYPQTETSKDENIVEQTISGSVSASQLVVASNQELQDLNLSDHATEMKTAAVANEPREPETLGHSDSSISGATESSTGVLNTEIRNVDDGGSANLMTNGDKDTHPHSHKSLLWITNISESVQEEDIRTLFSKIHIAVAEIQFVPGRPDNELYLDVPNAAEARRAVKYLNGKHIKGCQLHVELILNDKTNRETLTLPAVSTAESAMNWRELPQSPAQSQTSNVSDQSSNQNSKGGIEEGEISEEVEFTDESDEDESKDEEITVNKSFTRNDANDEAKEVIEIDSEDDDAMITNYADAEQDTRPADRIEPHHDVEVIDLEVTNDKADQTTQNTKHSTGGPQTLAELTAEELELQIRYFYITRDPTTIPETDPVRCLVCAGVGHVGSWCPAQTCSHCNTKGVHFSKDCSKVARCSRCRGQHRVDNCKLKLRPRNLGIICDLCKEAGHTEVDCELTWRSSGPIWRKTLPLLSVTRSCFICGDAGHLGNDCLLRQPGKPMGSSMWSNKGLPKPLASLTSTIDKDKSVPSITKKLRKMPNSKAMNIAAASAQTGGHVQSPASSFDPNKTQGWPDLIKKAKEKRGPVNIQIKGLANRTNLESRTPPEMYSPVQLPAQYRDHRANQNANYHDGYPIYSLNPVLSNRYHDGSGQGDFPRGRFGNSRYRSRSRSRSRSPRRWYQIPPRANYDTLPRDYRDRDNPNFSRGGNVWPPSGR